MPMTASPASCCSVYLEILVHTPKGRLQFGFATGFLYAGPNGTRWLVTNWHVVTGRWPDDPGHLTGKQPQSPDRLRFNVEDPAGRGRQLMEVPLYGADGPTWIESRRENGVDLALIRLTDPPKFPLPFTQTFAPSSGGELSPGQDVVIVGHPFELGAHAPSAIWKSAMVASDENPSDAGKPWILVDAPGMPGMSGSPVYRRLKEPTRSGSHSGAFDPADGVVPLELFGVYAGAVGERKLEQMQLGRVFPIGLVEDALHRKEVGRNPHPPELPAT